MMRWLLFGLLLHTLVWSVGARADYAYTTLQVPGSSGSIAYGINNSAQIVGQFQSDNPAGQYHGFLFASGSYTQLDVPGTVSGTIASAINSSGQIVGGYNQGLNGPGSGSAFLLSGGSYTSLPTPPFGGGVRHRRCRDQ